MQKATKGSPFRLTPRITLCPFKSSTEKLVKPKPCLKLGQRTGSCANSRSFQINQLSLLETVVALPNMILEDFYNFVFLNFSLMRYPIERYTPMQIFAISYYHLLAVKYLCIPKHIHSILQLISIT